MFFLIISHWFIFVKVARLFWKVWCHETCLPHPTPPHHLTCTIICMAYTYSAYHICISLYTCFAYLSYVDDICIDRKRIERYGGCPFVGEHVPKQVRHLWSGYLVADTLAHQPMMIAIYMCNIPTSLDMYIVNTYRYHIYLYIQYLICL